jgi:hypothetical protein
MTPTIPRFSLKLAALILVLVVFFISGCSLLTGISQTVGQLLNPATPTPVDPAAALNAFSDAEIMQAIQSTLDDYDRAYNTNDLALLQKVTDPKNLAFKRMVSNRFTSTQESIVGGSINTHLTADSIKRLKLGFVQAHILTGNGSAVDWLFRIYAGKWVLSEPTLEQFGTPYEKDTEHFTYKLFPWAEDNNEQIIKLMENAAKRVESKLGKLPTQKAKVIILPGYSADQFSDPNALAYYQTGRTGELDSITIFMPSSYSFGWYSIERGWAPDLEDTLTHEYTHMTHRRAFDNAGKLMDWFSEGLAEYVSDSPRYFEIQDALNPDRLIPIIDSVSTINQQDLRHIYLLEKDISLAYAEAESLIMYINANYGGMDAVWKVARADDEIQNFDKALKSSLGVDYATFDKDWRAWLRDGLFTQ